MKEKLKMKMVKILIGAAGALVFGSAQANILNLTTGYNVCEMTNGAEVCSAKTSDGSTGSGVFPAFVNGNTNDTDYFMYNTTGTIEKDNKVGNGSHQNQDVTLGNFAVSDYEFSNGVTTKVFTFVLDINEPKKAANAQLSIDRISIYLGNGALTGYDSAANTLGGTSAAWTMGAGDIINLQYSLAAGSGRGDMFLYVPISYFSGPVTTHLQLLTIFGDPYDNDSSFEEWSYLSCVGNPGSTCYVQRVPEPATLALMGLGLLGLGAARRRKLVR